MCRRIESNEASQELHRMEPENRRGVFLPGLSFDPEN